MIKKIMLLVAVGVMLIVMVSPAAAKGSGNTGVIGEPPGWSIVNPGNGGSDGPGQKGN